MRTALIMAGGTGGHVFPGLAVADELRTRGWRVVWMGTRAGMEARLVTARGYELAAIRAVALRGKGLAAKLLLPLNLLIGFWQSARTIFRLRPDVVLGMGGYVAFPGGMMASLLARPLAVHEQNAIAGLTKSTALDGRPYDIACGQIDIGNAATDMTTAMAAGVPQADGSVRAEPRMRVEDVARAVVYMASLPLDANVATITVLPSKMPYVGRG